MLRFRTDTPSSLCAGSPCSHDSQQRTTWPCHGSRVTSPILCCSASRCVNVNTTLQPITSPEHAAESRDLGRLSTFGSPLQTDLP
ncbi:hypothetical protein M3J09_006793 [Ascochyta lentis]